MTAALKFVQIIRNVETILAIELMCAAQALEFLKPLRPGPLLGEVYRRVRESVPALDHDEPLSDYIAALIPLVRYTSRRSLLGEATNRWWTTALAVVAAALLVGLNATLIVLLVVG